MQQIMAIALGGAVGAVLRFLATNGVHRLLGKDFPYGTLLVNVLGSLLMGFLFIMLVERELVSELWRSAILIGLIGAFTTFSTFSFETLTLMESGEWLKAGLNIVLNVTVCIVATWLGFSLARQL